MSDYSQRGPYVGYAIPFLDEKHRISLSGKIAEKLKQRSKSNILYFYACYREREDNQVIRLLRLYDQEFYYSNQEEIHPGGLEETKLQANDRLQIPLPLYQFLGFNADHRYAMIVADRSGHYYHIYNLGSLVRRLPEDIELGTFLPSRILNYALCDSKLKDYLVNLSRDGYTNSPRVGYEWITQYLSPQEEELPSLSSSKPSSSQLTSSEREFFKEVREPSASEISSPLSSPFEAP